MLACLMILVLLPFVDTLCAPFSPPARQCGNRRPALRCLPAVVASETTELVSPALLSQLAPTQVDGQSLDIDLLWRMLSEHTLYLSNQDRENVRLSLRVLLTKAETALRSQRWSSDCDEVEPALTAPGRTVLPSTLVLSVLTSVQTAQDLLKLQLDVVTVCAAMLAQTALTSAAPTWPCLVPNAFTCAVDELLVAERHLAELSNGAVLLADAPTVASSAELVRMGLLARGAAEPRALIVILARQLQLLRAVEALPPAAQTIVALQAVHLYTPLSQAIGFGGVFNDLEAISYRKLFPETVAKLQTWYEEEWPDTHLLLPQLVEQLRAQLETAPSLDGLVSDFEITARAKTLTSTLRKMLRRSTLDVEQVQDVIALRVVLTPAPDAEAQLAMVMRLPTLSAFEADALLCHGVYRQVVRLWKEVPGRFKDFVTAPKANGYQSIHTNARLPDGRLVEVQIRTAEMHREAERGRAAHGLYKGGITQPSQLASVADTLQAMRSLPALPSAGGTAAQDADDDLVTLTESAQIPAHSLHREMRTDSAFSKAEPPPRGRGASLPRRTS